MIAAALRPAIAAAAIAAASCRGSADPTPDASAQKPVPTAAPVDTLVKAALACKTYDQSFDSSCPGMKAWSDAEDGFLEGAADEALVALLADTDDKIRYLAAYKLNQHGKTFKIRKPLAEAVVAAAEKERSRFPGHEIGSAVGRVQVGDTGTFDRVAAMVKKHEVADLRSGIVGNLLFNNPSYAPAYDIVRDAVKDPDKIVAREALSAFWTSGENHPDAACQLFFDTSTGPDDDLAAEACNYLSWFKQCGSRYDALLDGLDKRLKAGTLSSAPYLTSARHVCEDPKSTDKQRKRAADLGHTMANRRDAGAWMRSAALDTVMKCDPGGKVFVAKFKKDAEKSVADKAAELAGKK